MQRKDLCMRNFKRVVLFLAVVIAYEMLFSFLLEPVTYQHFLETELKADEAAGVLPDMVVIGNSSVEMAFVPSVLEEGIGDVSCVLNAGTGSQKIWGTYYYLKDLLRQYDIKYVVVGIDYSAFFGENSKNIKKDLLVLDRIHSFDIRVEYIKNHFEKKEYIYLLKSYRYRGGVGSIAENVRKKLDESYREGVDSREGTYYQERGYVHSTERGEFHTGIYDAYEIHVDQASGKVRKYLDKIVELCREEKVELYLVTLPTSFSGIYGSDTYQSAIDYFNDYASARGVPFCDMNLMRNRTEVFPDCMLSDEGHLGYNGAAICSGIYAEVFNRQHAGEDVSDYFYHSVEEMKKDIKGIVVCDLGTKPYGEEGDRIIRAKSIHEENVIPEYEFWIREEGGQWMKLQEYSENAECFLPAQYLESKIEIQVNCRSRGSNAEWEKRKRISKEPET